MIEMVIVLFFFGLLCGSFVNALIWRLHAQSNPTRRKNNSKRAARHRNANLSIWTGRSVCTRCYHVLAAKDLIPLVSWLMLHGRCRYCHKTISRQYPLVECFTGLLFIGLFLCWPFSLHGIGLVLFIFTLMCSVLFVALGVYDYKWYILPDKLVFTLLGVAILQAAAMSILHREWRLLIDPALGGILLFGLFWLIYQISDGQGIGGGDVKLALPLGIIAGNPIKALLVLFFASMLGTLGSISLLKQGKAGLQKHIPFGPYLLAACILVVLFSDRIGEWYTSSLL
ncbi:MAG: prepilin peptidase [Candidatus Saccharimonadales bacterium]|nr:prepilin peptidase [Candidatus Saccharibacteria bacterium]